MLVERCDLAILKTVIRVKYSSYSKFASDSFDLYFWYKCIRFLFFVASMAQPVPEQIDFPKEEEKILQLWTDLNAFQTSLLQSKNRPRFEICNMLHILLQTKYVGLFSFGSEYYTSFRIKLVSRI